MTPQASRADVTPGASVLDLRTVPAALVAWVVTAAGITCQAGFWLAALSAAAGLGWWGAGRWGGQRWPSLRAGAAAVLSAAAVGVGFGVAVGLRTEAAEHHVLAQRIGSTVEVTITPTETPHRAGPGRVMFRADLNRVDNHESSGGVLVFAPGLDFADLGVGQPARFRAKVSRPKRRDLSVAVLHPVSRAWFGAPSRLQSSARAVRERFAAAARDVLAPDQASILPALVLGDTAAVPAAITADFRAAGLTHLMAVSGANVTIVCAAVLLSAYLFGPRAAVTLAALALVGFVVVVQPSPSVLRAAVMAAIGLMAVLSGRRRQAVPVLAATVLALMLISPQLSVEAGFALSVAATAGLVVIAPVWSARLVARGWPKPLSDGLCVAVTAQLATAPLIAAISGTFSLVSVLANLLAAVVIAPITVIGTSAAVLGCLWPQAAGFLIRFTGPELWWLLRVARGAARMPGATLAVPSGWAGMVSVAVVSLGAVAMWRWRWFRVGALGIALCVVAWSVSGLVGAA
jgi:competence protein ComEC